MRRAKGEQTSQKILDATLHIISEEGLRAVNHRSVAAKAGLQLSLISYYFHDIDNLLVQCYQFFCQFNADHVDELWLGMDEIITRYSAIERRKLSVRKELAALCGEHLSQYIYVQMSENQAHMKAAHILLANFSGAKDLQQQAIDRRHFLYSLAVPACRRLNSKTPELDAEILLETMISMETKFLTEGGSEEVKENILRVMRRQVGWMMGLKHE